MRVITGASSGIGLGLSQALLERGYRVVANSRSISRSKDLKSAEDLVNMSQQVIPQMMKQNSGHVVNISAVLADQPSDGVTAEDILTSSDQDYFAYAQLRDFLTPEFCFLFSEFCLLFTVFQFKKTTIHTTHL